MKRSSDMSIFIGMAIGFGGIIAGFMLDKGSPASLVGIPALIIIVAGTMGALVTSFSLKDVLSIGKHFSEAMTAPAMPSQAMADKITELAEKARKEGLLNLEEIVEELEEPFLKKGLKLVIDGVESDTIENMLENDISLSEMKTKHKMLFFESAGGYSPTMGIIGTVCGLVLVLGSLGGDTAELGKAIATAFIATLYGISFANLIWLPLAAKLKNKVKYESLAKKMLLTGILSIQHGESPTIVRQKLEGYLMEGK
jgi:chemotaxis protein MotA